MHVLVVLPALLATLEGLSASDGHPTLEDVLPPIVNRDPGDETSDDD